MFSTITNLAIIKKYLFDTTIKEVKLLPKNLQNMDNNNAAILFKS